MDILLIKRNGALLPADDIEAEKLKKIKPGQAVKVKLTKYRNYEFHKKWFALVNLAYDSWEPNCIDERWGIPEKNFDQFRKGIIIKTGRYKVYSSLAVENGQNRIRIEADSISFASMSEEEFAVLYSQTVDVILKNILTNYTKADLERVVQEIMQFT